MPIHHRGTVPLITGRLLLRRFHIEDAPQMFENWAGDPAVTAFLSWTAHRTPADTRRVLCEWVTAYQRPDFYTWAIVRREDGALMGSISIYNLNSYADACEAGYCLGRNFWGGGYAAEALRAVLALCFAMGFVRVCAKHDPDNPHSGRVMQKAGMQREGTMRRAVKAPDGRYRAMVLYAATQESALDADGRLICPAKEDALWNCST